MSYGRQDKDFVDRLVEDLTKDEEHFVYLDRAEILAGDLFTDDIPKAIVRSDYVVVVLSPQSATSVWVAFEAGLAKTEEITTEGRKKIIPISVGAVTVPGFLAGRSMLEFAADGSDFAENVKELLKAVADDREGGPRQGDVPRSQGPEALTIFKTRKQTTRLEKSVSTLQCYLADERPDREGVQWKMPIGQARELAKGGKITARLRKGASRAGYLDIGPRRNWLYSTKLFPIPEKLVEAVKKLILGD